MAITQDDFGKVWASTSSVPEYTFSDSDYHDGWEFVGNLPPTRAMWDTLQRRNDQKMEYLYHNTEGTVSVKQYGAKGDGVTDDTVAFRNAINSGYIVYVPKGHYICNSAIENTTGLTMYGDGDESVIDFGSSVPNGIGLSVNGSITQIANITNANKGDTTITFASDPGLSVGDVFCIFNPTASSFSTFRTYYNAGEWCEVTGVSGNTVNLANALYDSYISTDVEVWKMNSVPVDLHDFRIVGTSTNILMAIKFCKNASIRRVSSSLEKLICVSVSKSYNVNVEDVVTLNIGTNQDDYGLVIGNSQNIFVSGGNYYARRHGIAIGGDSSDTHVPNRHIRIKNATISNDKTSSIHAADMHGNSEDVIYESCYIDGGVSLQGKNNTCKGCRITSISNGVIVYCAEILGGTMTIEDCDCISFVNPHDTNRPYFRFPFGSGTAEDVSIRVLNCTLDCQNTVGIKNIVGIINESSVNQRFEVNGITLKNIIITGVNFNVLYLSNSGTAKCDYIIVDNIIGIPTDGLSPSFVSGNNTDYYNAPMKLQKQSGTLLFTIPTGEYYKVESAVYYPIRYTTGNKVIGTVSVTPRSAIAIPSNTWFVAGLSECLSTRLTPYVYSPTLSVATAERYADVSWSVEVNDL